MGRLAFDMQWSRINLFRRVDGGDVFQYAGTHGNCDVTNCAGTPKNRANAGLTWSKDRWSASLVANYIGSFDNIAFENDLAGCANIFADGSDAPDGCRIPSFTTIDLSGKWKLLAEAGAVGSGAERVRQDRTARSADLWLGGLQPDALRRRGRPLFHGRGALRLQLIPVAVVPEKPRLRPGFFHARKAGGLRTSACPRPRVAS